MIWDDPRNQFSTTKQCLPSKVQQVFDFHASTMVFTAGSSSCFADWTLVKITVTPGSSLWSPQSSKESKGYTIAKKHNGDSNTIKSLVGKSCSYLLRPLKTRSTMSLFKNFTGAWFCRSLDSNSIPPRVIIQKRVQPAISKTILTNQGSNG